MKVFRTLVVIVGVAILVANCFSGNELSRGEAEKQLKTHDFIGRTALINLKFDFFTINLHFIPEFNNMTGSNLSGRGDLAITASDSEFQSFRTNWGLRDDLVVQLNGIRALYKSGVATTRIWRRDEGGGWLHGYAIMEERLRSSCLPQNGKTYEPGSANCVAVLATGKVHDVTGVSGGDKEKTVDFTIAFEPTVFGKLFGVQPYTESRQATFILYDDGWRLTKTPI